MFTQDKTYEISALAWGQEIIFYICFGSLFCLPWLQIRNSVSSRTSHLDWRIQGGSSARTCQGSPAIEVPENIFWKRFKWDRKIAVDATEANRRDTLGTSWLWCEIVRPCSSHCGLWTCCGRCTSRWSFHTTVPTWVEPISEHWNVRTKKLFFEQL